MPHDQHALVNFLNHGLMPFVGRTADMIDILAFRDEGGTADRLRSMLVTAEAGMGKSRLIEEILPEVRAAEGLPLHVKLLPESATQLVPLLSNALRSSPAARRILKGVAAPDDPVSLLAALRRLARLRPLLIVLEDLHVLHELPADDFAMLVEHLSDEPLSLLCFGRPLESSVYALLEPSLVRRRSLSPLSVPDVVLLWHGIFGDQIAGEERGEGVEEIARVLQRVSRGSPLALRAVIREGIASGAIRIGREGAAPPQVDPERLLREGESSALRIGMGMTASLGPDERALLGRLSLLGEAFSREAVRLVLHPDEGDELPDRLVYRGMLAPLRTPVAPLAGLDRDSVDFPESASLPLGFTHTLLHRYCVESAAGSRSFLALTLALDAPLYSLTPVAEFLRSPVEEWVDEETLYAALLRCANVIHEVILSPSWKRGGELVELLEKGIARAKDRLNPERHRDLYIVLLFKKAIVAENGNDMEGWRSALEEAMRLTASPDTPALARQRIGTIAKNPDADWRSREFCRAALAEVEALADRRPELRVSFDYRLFMCLMGVFGTVNDDPDLVDKTEEYYRRVIAGNEEGRIREMLDTWFLPVLMQKFETAEELALRMRQFRIVEGIPSGRGHATHVADHTIMFLFDTGMVDPLIRRIDESLELFRITNVLQLYVRARVRRIVARGLIGAPSAELEREAENLLSENILPDYAGCLLGSALAETFWLRGDPSRSAALLERFPESAEALDPSLRSLLASLVGSGGGTGEMGGNGTNDQEEIHRDLDRCLNAPLLRLRDLVSRTALVAYVKGDCKEGAGKKIEGKKRSGSKSDGFSSASAQSPVQQLRPILEECVAWCAERKLAGPFEGLLPLARGIVPDKRLKEWHAVAESIRREREERNTRKGDGTIFLSVFGTITVDDGDGEPRRISGGRMKTILSLMAANAVADHSLSLEEFALLASGDEDADPDSARNNLYVRLHSLRKLLGADAILSDTGQAPRLNGGRVRVDLVEMTRTLAAVREQRARENPGRSAALLRSVLEQAGGSVLFPGLYDRFFDAARDDFDVLLRDTVLLLAERLADEGDPESVAHLLRAALERTPDDEELAELLCTTLTTLGRKSQAERIRRSMKYE